MSFEPLFIRFDGKCQWQRDRVRITDTTFVTGTKINGRGEIDPCGAVALKIELRRHTCVTRVAPIGFPSRVQINLQCSAQFIVLFGPFENDTDFAARRLRPVGRCCQHGEGCGQNNSHDQKNA